MADDRRPWVRATHQSQVWAEARSRFGLRSWGMAKSALGGRSWLAGNLARMARVLGRSCPMELPQNGTRAGGLGSRNAPIGRASSPWTWRTAQGWAGLPVSLATRAHRLGNDFAGGCRGAWRQALAGSEGLSFMR